MKAMNMKGKLRFIFVILAAMLLVIPQFSMVANAADAVSYVSRSWNGTAVVSETKTVTDYTVVTSSTTSFADGGWYVVNSDVTVSSRITVSGSAYLILADGCTLTASSGIAVNSGNSLTIYGQTNGTGALVANGSYPTAGIGGNGRTAAGTIIICGGKITATGNARAAGIGGGGSTGTMYSGGSGGTVTIYGGTVSATGSSAAGIGHGYNASGGTTTIYGGSVNAVGGISGTLTNGSVSISLNTITLPGAANLKVAEPTAISGYSLSDVVTDANGKLYFYLPAGTELPNSFTTSDGTGYIRNDDGTYRAHEHSWTEAICIPQLCTGCDTVLAASGDHSFVDGICTRCGMGEDGVFYIATAQQLRNFAQHVNSGNVTANAILTADIDMTGIRWKPIAPVEALNYSDTNYVDTGYAGTFDGNGHTISNLTITRNSEKQATVGMFGTVSGEVKHLHIDNAYYYRAEDVDGRFSLLVGQLLPNGKITDCVVSNSTMEMKDSYVGGAIAGCNYGGTIENCVSWNNTINANTRCGNLVGDNKNDATETDKMAIGTVTNCYSTSTLAGGYGGSGTVTDSVAYLGNYNSYSVLMAVYDLSESSEHEWKIKDGVPGFVGDTVYLNTCEGDIFYSTTEGNHEEHSLGDDFRCTLCGRYDTPAKSGNYYQIATPSQLFWLAETVNEGAGTLHAVLTNDIDLNNVEWVSIGISKFPFKGSFNGRNYTISGYKQTITAAGDYGLFGNVNSGNTAGRATIQNFTINGEAISNITTANTTGAAFRYGVIGYMFYGTVENVHSSVNLIVKDSSYKDAVAGIVGTSESGLIGDTWYWNYIRKCSFSGKLDFGTSQVDSCGGIVGYVGYNNTFKMENCLFDGIIHSDYASAQQIGGLMGYNRGRNVWIENCLSVGTIDLVNTDLAGAIAGRYIINTDNDYSVLSKNKVNNNYYLVGTLPAFANGEDSFGGGWYDIVDFVDANTYPYTYSDSCAKLVTAEQLASGEIQTALNGTGTVWKQKIGMDDYPHLKDREAKFFDASNSESVVQVSITWTEMSFTYDHGTWNPETHAFDGSCWKSDTEGCGTVTLTNNGSTVYVSLSFESSVDGVSGSFNMTSDELASGASATYILTLSGQPTGDGFTEQQLGTIEIKLSLEPIETD